MNECSFNCTRGDVKMFSDLESWQTDVSFTKFGGDHSLWRKVEFFVPKELRNKKNLRSISQISNSLLQEHSNNVSFIDIRGSKKIWQAKT